MKLVGFNFSKISMEKFTDKLENVKIDTKINVSEIKRVETNLLKLKEDVMGIDFNYVISYDPDIAKIELNGTVLLAVDSSMRRDLLKKWENKEMPGDFKFTLFNIILRKSNLRAMQLEDEMNLPLHVPLPALKKQAEESTDSTKNL